MSLTGHLTYRQTLGEQYPRSQGQSPVSNLGLTPTPDLWPQPCPEGTQWSLVSGIDLWGNVERQEVLNDLSGPPQS